MSGRIIFLYKYFSQLQDWYSLIDANNNFFRKVISFLQKKSDWVNENIVLTNHFGLYGLLNSSKNTRSDLFSDYQIAFLDTKWRYTSFNKFLNQEIDFYVLLEKIDFLQYKFQILAESNLNYQKHYEIIYRLNWSFSVFVWIFYIEATKFLSNLKKNKWIVYDFVNNPSFLRSSVVWNRLRNFFVKVQDIVSSQEIEEILSFLQKISEILNSNFKLQTKIFWQSWLYFTIQNEVSYVDFAEFLSVFNNRKICFFQTDWTDLRLKNKDQTKQKKPEYLDLTSIVSIISYLSKNTKDQVSNSFFENKNIFVVSNNKEMSKKLLFDLKSKWFDKKYQLLWENITWWVKKNISKAMEKGSKIIIWGYNFFLWLQEKKVFLDKIIFFQVSWPLKETIISDMKRRLI